MELFKHEYEKLKNHGNLKPLIDSLKIWLLTDSTKRLEIRQDKRVEMLKWIESCLVVMSELDTFLNLIGVKDYSINKDKLNEKIILFEKYKKDYRRSSSYSDMKEIINLIIKELVKMDYKWGQIVDFIYRLFYESNFDGTQNLNCSGIKSLKDSIRNTFVDPVLKELKV